ncbi:IS110 family transposase [Pedobacter lithocola]|uniref:IS110 family transposase n=1 Tax=Pedobacter lithocola TaxID=1908239 RepID=A0ABV8PCL2_9SPHI
MKNFKFFIGIDVSKPYVDVAVVDEKGFSLYSRVENNPESLLQFINGLKKTPGIKISNSLFGLENTGYYGNHLLKALHTLKASVVNENPVLIKNSLGLIRGKDDKLDANRIAEYLCLFQKKLTIWSPKRPILNELSQLLSLRERLSAISLKLKVPLKEEKEFITKALSHQNTVLCAKSIDAIKDDISVIEKRIKLVWSSDEQLKHQMSIIMSIPCIGELTALNIILSTNEFKNISSPKKFACYAGVAPFKRQSGISIIGTSRISHIANKKTKSLLHTCAVLSVRFVPEIKAYFLRKTVNEKKHKMLVYNAIRSKLILRVFSLIKENRLYQADYIYGSMEKS